jgi:hypothetical protein
MSVNRFVGSTWARLGTLTCAAASAWLAIAAPGGGRGAFWGAIAAGVLAFAFFVHSFRPVFDRWMAFAEALHAAVIKVLFTACYLLLVPFFAAVLRRRDPLRRRQRRNQSSWVTQRADVSPASFERMG